MTAAAPRNLYITAMAPRSGKSIVALGLMETLSARSERVGFFRPIVAGGSAADPQLELIRGRYGLSGARAAHALTTPEAVAMIAAGDHDRLQERVFGVYKALEANCDVVVCEGTDFNAATPGIDLGLNAELANQLGCPVLVVVGGASPAEIASTVRLARGTLTHKGCTLFGVIVNRVAVGTLGEMRRHSVVSDRSEPMYVLAESPELAHPTMAEVALALEAEVVIGADGAMQREVHDVRVAAMSVEHFIEDLVDGTLVIVPGDRPDILVACLASTLSTAVPAVAGVVITGGYAVGGTVTQLLRAAPFAVLRSPLRTYLAATAVHDLAPTIDAASERKIATALGVFEAGVDPVELAERIALPRRVRTTPMMFQYELIERAKARRRHVVLPEGHDDRVLAAADALLRRDVVALTILGTEEGVRGRASALGLKLDAADVVDPLTSSSRDAFAAAYHELRRHRGVTPEGAYDAVADSSYFGTLMVQSGAADGMVSGAAHTTADTIRPAFEIIKARPGTSVVSSVFFMCLADRVLVYGDCAVNPKPDADQLAAIAVSSAATAESFGIEPRVAMLSYSTGESGSGADVETVRSATRTARQLAPQLKLEGPIQYDAAVDAAVGALKLPGSEVAGQATVFIFPDLDTGNVAYKAVQRSAGAIAIGPVLQGLRKPVNDLSRGCSVVDILNTVAITAIQAQTGTA